MDTHVRLTGILWIAWGALGIIVGFVVLMILLSIGVFSQTQTQEPVLPILSMIGLAIAAITSILSLPSVIAGIGILKRRNWGRIIGLVLAAINLLNIPFGTALGIYTLWVLLNQESESVFS